MLRVGIFSLFLLNAVACKSTDATLLSQPQESKDCSDAGHLERVLSLLDPSQVQPDRRLCITSSFQETLVSGDIYDLPAVQKASSQLRGFTYTKDNIFDRKAYIRGPAIFKAHRRLIAEAQEEVLLQTYIWESVSASAQEIMGGLKDLQENRRQLCPNCRPVVVRILANHGPTALDPIGAITTGERSPDSGADARKGITGLGLDPRILDVQVLTYTHKAFGTNHVKSMVVDGQIAIVTGANVQRFNDPDINWYDVGYMMGGAVAEGLRTDLINNLIRAGLGTERDGDEKLAAGIGTSYRKVFNTIYPIEKMMEQPLADSGGMPAVIAGRNGNGVPSNDNNNAQNRAFQALMMGAQKWIHVQTPNINDDAAIRSLAEAVKRGVRVDMIASKLFNCASENQIGQGGQNERGYLRLMQAIGAPAPQGPRHDFRWFGMMQDGGAVRVVDNVNGKKPEERRNNSHAKFMSVDDEVVVVGSANMDTQSWNQSRELNVLVFHPEIVKAWQDQVYAANYQIAQPVTAGEVKDDAINCQMKL